MRISINNKYREDFQEILDECRKREIDGNTIVVQTYELDKVDVESLKLFNEMILSVYPYATFRIFPNDDVDLDKLKYISDLKVLSIEGNVVTNTKSIGELEKLEILKLYVYRIDNFDFLKNLTNLKTLSITGTKTVKPDLTNLKYLHNLEELGIEKFKKGLESIKELKNLIGLNLKGQKLNNFDFLPNHILDYLGLYKIKCDIPIESCNIKAREIFVDGKELNFEKNLDEKENVMPFFQLTNNERKYLGLDLVEEHWELVELVQGDYIYFDGNTIKKRIIVSKSRYREEGLNIETENREIILPSTSRGKPKKLTSSTLGNGKGVYIAIKIKKNENDAPIFTVGNYTNQLSLFNSKFFSIPNFTSFEEVRKFIKTIIDETTEENLKELEQFKNGKRKRVKYKTGDFFRIKIDRKGNYIYGRILITLSELRKYDDFKKTKNYGLANLMTVPVIAKTYRYIGGKDVDLYKLREKEAFPTYVTMDNRLLYGEYEIIGNLPIEDIDLQDMWISYRRSINNLDKDIFYLQWGMIYCETHIDNVPEHLRTSRYRDESVGFSDGFKDSEEFYKCLEAKSNQPYWEVKTHNRYDDLRNPINKEARNEILEFFGLNSNLNYAENFKIWCKDKEDREYLKNYKL